jgi:hypothetical protein
MLMLCLPLGLEKFDGLQRVAKAQRGRSIGDEDEMLGESRMSVWSRKRRGETPPPQQQLHGLGGPLRTYEYRHLPRYHARLHVTKTNSTSVSS